MKDSIPNSIFVFPEHQMQMDSIITFRDELKGKHSDLFKTSETYMALRFGGPKTNIKGNPLELTILYSENIPVSIRRELELFVAKYIPK